MDLDIFSPGSSSRGDVFYAEAEKYYKNRKLPSIGLVEGPSKKKKYAFSILEKSINCFLASASYGENRFS